MMTGDRHGQHAPKRISKQHGWGGDTLAEKAGNIFRILRSVVSARNAGGFAMAAQIGREDMPTQAQRRNQRQKYLPATAQPMQQHKWRAMRRTFGIVQ